MTNASTETKPAELVETLPWIAAEQIMSPLLAGMLYLSVVSVFSLSTMIGGLPVTKPHK